MQGKFIFLSKNRNERLEQRVNVQHAAGILPVLQFNIDSHAKKPIIKSIHTGNVFSTMHVMLD